MLTISEATTVLSAIEQYGTPAIVLFVLLLAMRSRPGRALTWVLGTEVRYQYLRRRGFSDKEMHAWLRRRDKDWVEPASTSWWPRSRSSATSSTSDEQQKAAE